MFSRFFCLLLLILVATAVSADDPAQAVDYSKILTGRKIGQIYVNVKDIFPAEEDLSWLYRKANGWKYTTQDPVILRELTFKPGMEITNFHIRESSRNIRTLDFIRRVDIKPIIIDAETIDVYVEVQDTWTLIPQVSYSSGDGRNKQSFGLAESDLFGLGKRLEFLVEDDDGRKTTQTVYDDRRFFGSENQFELAQFQRSDGDIHQISLERPLRTLFDDKSFGVSFLYGDTAERLFRNNEERYVYRDKNTDFDIFYTFVKGQPEIQSRRYSFGYNYFENNFSDADADDYDDLGIDLDEVTLEDVELPEDRRFVGPYFAFESIQPQFISKNYIDRFDRFDDYNLGNQSSMKFQLAPEALGSDADALLFSASTGTGWLFTPESFLRGEIGVGTRYLEEEGTLENSIIRSDLRYYNLLGNKKIGGLSLGNHTLAAAFTMDYAQKLDRDREFLLGADNFLRGYSARTFSGDKRIAINLEDRIHWKEDVWKLISLGTVFFIDVGTSTTDSLSTAIQDEVYSDVGFGLRIGLPRSSGSRVLRFDVAFPMRDGPDGTEAYDPRFLFSASQSFNSFLRTEVISRERATVDTGF